MPTTQETVDLEGDGQMISLCGAAAARYAADVINEGAPASTADRMQWAQDAVAAAFQITGLPIWRYLLGEFKGSSAEDVSRSEGNPALPTDATLDNAVIQAVDALHPKGA